MAKRLSVGLTLLAARFLGLRRPLAVAWAVTKRCNFRCRYCSVWESPPRELDTREGIRLIDELSEMGTLRLSFTGGEPLLRDDIGILIGRAASKGIRVGLNSNGSLVLARRRELEGLSHLGLSLEGPQEVHDRLRHPGSFRQVMESARFAAERGIKILFNATLNSCNVEHIDMLLDLTRSLGARIVFQPATENLLGGESENPVALTAETCSRAVALLQDRKRSGYSDVIRNSHAGLKHLSHWPNLPRVACAGGRITCRIEPDGTLYHCARMKRLVPDPLSCGELGFREAFLRLPRIRCDKCCCAMRVEACSIFRLAPSALLASFAAESGGG